MHLETQLIDVWRGSERAPKRREGETARSSGQMSMIRAKAQSRLLQGKSERLLKRELSRLGAARSPLLGRLSLRKTRRIRALLTPAACL